MTSRIDFSDLPSSIGDSSDSSFSSVNLSDKENEALRTLFVKADETLSSLQPNQQHIPKNIHEKLWKETYKVEKKQHNFNNEQEFAIHILINRSKYKPEMILAAALRFLGSEHSKRLPNMDIVYRAPFKKGREDKIRIIKMENFLARGGQNIIYLATGMAFVKRGEKVSYSGEKKRVVRALYSGTTLMTGLIETADIETPRAIHLHAKEKLGKGMEKSIDGAEGVARAYESIEPGLSSGKLYEGDLMTWIEKEKPTDVQILKVYRGAWKALAALVRDHVFHLDIKPDNFLVEIRKTFVKIFKIKIFLFSKKTTTQLSDFDKVISHEPIPSNLSPKEVLKRLQASPIEIDNIANTPRYNLEEDLFQLVKLIRTYETYTQMLDIAISEGDDEIEVENIKALAEEAASTYNACIEAVSKIQVFQTAYSLLAIFTGLYNSDLHAISENRIPKDSYEETINNLFPKKIAKALVSFFESTVSRDLDHRISALEAVAAYDNLYKLL